MRFSPFFSSQNNQKSSIKIHHAQQPRDKTFIKPAIDDDDGLVESTLWEEDSFSDDDADAADRDRRSLPDCVE